MKDFYVPKTKFGLIEYLKERYPKANVSSWRRMRKNRLYAIFFGARKKVKPNIAT